MEPNTTCPSAAETFSAIVDVEQALPSAQAETQLSPLPFLPPPSPGLMSEWASGSVLPAMEQLEHATSLPPLLSTPFPELGEFHMAGGEGDFFAQQEAPPAATNIPAAVLGGHQPPQGLTQPSSGEWSAPAFPNAAFAGFTDQPALLEPNAASAWQNETPLLSLPSGSGLPAPSIGGGVGSAIPSSKYDLAPLPASLHVSSMDEAANMYNMPSTIDASLQIPSMQEASMYNMPGTIDGSLMHRPCGSSSMGVGSSMSSLQDLTSMGAPVLPMTSPQLFQGVGSFMSSQQDMTIDDMSQDVGNFMSSQQDMTIGAMGAPVLPMTTPSLPQGVASSMPYQQDLIIGAMGPPAPLPMTASMSQDVGSFMTSQQDLTIGDMSTSMLPMAPSLPRDVGNSMSSPQDMTIGGMEAPVLPMTASMAQDVGSFMTSQQDLTVGAMSRSMMQMTPSLPQGAGNSMSSAQDMTIGAMEGLEAPVLPMTSLMATGAMGAPALPMTASMSQDVGSFMTSQQDLTIEDMSTSMLPMTPSLPQGIGNSMSSLQDMTIGAMEAPVLPMTTASSQGQLAQPTSEAAELTPAASTSLQAPLLPVKEEPVDVTATPREPVFVSLIDDDDEDELDQDAIPHLMPDSSTTGSDQSLATKLKMLEEAYNIRTMSRGGNKSYMKPPMPRSSSARACARSTLSSSTWAGASSTISAPARAGDSNTLLSSREGDSSSHTNVNGVLFTDAEMEILKKDKNMQELSTTDTKKAKRTIANRIYSARRNARKEKLTHELEHHAETLQTKWKEMSIQLQLQQAQCAELKANNRDMSMMMQELKQQNMLKDAMNEVLLAEVQRLRRSQTSDSGVHGLDH